MQDYKNNKILELKKEIVKVSNQTDYEINGVDTSRALFFYRKEKEKFKIIPRGSYSVVDVATNKYLRISDTVLLGEAIEFQVCYLFVKTSSSYVDPFPELERLQEHYNELYSDFNNLLQQLESNNIVGDTMKMAYVLPQLDEGQVWVLRQGEMKAEAIFDLDERLREAYENFTRIFDNWIQTEKKPEFTQFVNSEKDRVLQDIETTKTQSIEELDSHTTDKIAEIEAEGISQKNQVTQEGTRQIGLVTAEGNKQVQRVTEEGNNQVANVENEGETQLNKIKATGIDAKQDKIDNTLQTDSKIVAGAINELFNKKLNINQSPSLVSQDGQSEFHFDWLNDIAGVRIGGDGTGANNGFQIRGINDDVLLWIKNNRELLVGGIYDVWSNSNVELLTNPIGFMKYPNGVIVQWGDSPCGTQILSNFPTAFNSHCVVIPQSYVNGNLGATDVIVTTPGEVTLTGFRVNSWGRDWAPVTGHKFSWIAIGY